ncbi:MAG: hypothetical protein AB7H90_14305 [Alphaproteobacteria bacterium]
MKLNTALVERTIDQLDADPVPERHPVMPQLKQAFGDHTFFVDTEGLHIIEPGEPNERGEPTGEVVQIARWDDENRTSLSPQPPEPTGIVVVLGKEPGSDG